MKTNLTPIDKHVLSIIDFSGYEDKENTVSNVLTTLMDEYGHEVKRLGMRKAFKEWASGLPSCFNVLFYYNDVNEFLVKSGVKLSNSDSNNFHLYLDLVYNSLLKLSNR